MKKVIYEGVFFDGLVGVLDKIPKHHMTTAFKPFKPSPHLYGEKVVVTIKGYGNDGQNEGYKVAFMSGPDEVRDIVSKIRIPHITLSISKEGKPVNTANLQFNEKEYESAAFEFFLIGTFGAFVSEDGGPAHPYFGS